MRGCKPGERRGGRVKGQPNRKTIEVAETLARLKCDPIAGMARIANGDVDCGVCHGKGRTKYQPARGEAIAERTCESCYGSGKERISPELKGKMHAELAQYLLPKRKAIEVSGPGGGPLLVEILNSRLNRINAPNSPDGRSI